MKLIEDFLKYRIILIVTLFCSLFAIGLIIKSSKTKILPSELNNFQIINSDGNKIKVINLTTKQEVQMGVTDSPYHLESIFRQVDDTNIVAYIDNVIGQKNQGFFEISKKLQIKRKVSLPEQVPVDFIPTLISYTGKAFLDYSISKDIVRVLYLNLAQNSSKYFFEIKDLGIISNPIFLRKDKLILFQDNLHNINILNIETNTKSIISNYRNPLIFGDIDNSSSKVLCTDTRSILVLDIKKGTIENLQENIFKNTIPGKFSWKPNSSSAFIYERRSFLDLLSIDLKKQDLYYMNTEKKLDIKLLDNIGEFGIDWISDNSKE